jgi:hypothetical protein
MTTSFKKDGANWRVHYSEIVVNSFSILFEGSLVRSPGLFVPQSGASVSSTRSTCKGDLSATTSAKDGVRDRVAGDGSTSSATSEWGSICAEPRGNIDEVILQDDEIL